MGGVFSRRNVAARRNLNPGDRIELVDIVPFLLHGMPLTSVKAPTCLDELVDWTELANELVEKIGDEINHVQFAPFIMADVVGPTRDSNRANQSHVVGFPSGSAHDLAVFYEEKVRVVMVLQSKEQGEDLRRVLSVSNFCSCFFLLRRLSELLELKSCTHCENCGRDGRKICQICFEEFEQTLLPCLHGLCSECEKKWVDLKLDCPFCRCRFEDQRTREKAQWDVSLSTLLFKEFFASRRSLNFPNQVQLVIPADLDNDISLLKSKLEVFHGKSFRQGAVGTDEWKPLDSGVSVSVAESDEYILVQ